MEDFKKILRNRQILLVAGLLCACGLILFSRNYVKITLMTEHIPEFISGFQAGIISGIFGCLAFFIIRNIAAFRNPDRLKKLYISETDERKLFIRQKSNSAGMNIITYGLALGTAVFGNINDTVFLTLLAACFFVVAIRGFLKIYYRRKF